MLAIDDMVWRSSTTRGREGGDKMDILTLLNLSHVCSIEHGFVSKEHDSLFPKKNEEPSSPSQ